MIVDRQRQLITSRFGWRWINGKKNNHKGIDLRTWNIVSRPRKPQNILAPERIKIIDMWDNEKWGQGISFYFLDNPEWGIGVYRHIGLIAGLEKGLIIEKGMVLGKSMVTRFMKRLGFTHHLHFEIYKKGWKIVNPVLYMDATLVPYDWKWGVR